MLKNSNQGFTLMELLIVIVIIGILTAAATPSYKIYINRARFTEIVQAVEIFKTAIAIDLQQDVPIRKLTNGKYGIPPSKVNATYIEKIEVNQGIITAVGKGALNNITYVLKPNKDGTQWEVSGSCVKMDLCYEST